MRVYKVTPVVEYSPFFTLTYVSKIDFSVGSLVRVDFNRRKIWAVVVEVIELKDARVEIRKADFQTKKIEESERCGEKGEAFFTASQIKNLVNFSDQHLIPLGEIIFYLFGTEIDLKQNSFVKIFPKDDGKFCISDFNFQKYTLLTNPRLDRIKLFFLWLEDFYENKATLKTKYTFLGLEEKKFLDNFKSKKIKIIEEEMKSITKKFFVNVVDGEIISQEILQKIQNQKTFVFVLSTAYADRVYCNDCNKQYDCNNCGHGYSVLHTDDTKYLFCKSCKGKYELKEDQYLICKNCGSWRVFPFGTGIQKVKEFLIQNGMEAEIKNKQIVVGGIKELNKNKIKYDKVVVASLGPLVRGQSFDTDEKLIYLLSKLENIGLELYINKREGDEISLENFKNRSKFVEEEFLVRKKLHLPPFTKIVTIIFNYKSKKIVDKILLENLDLYNSKQEIKKGSKYIYYFIVDLDTDLTNFKVFRNMADLYVGNNVLTNVLY